MAQCCISTTMEHSNSGKPRATETEAVLHRYSPIACACVCVSMKMRKCSAEQASTPKKYAKEARCRMVNPDLHMLHVRLLRKRDEGSLKTMCMQKCVRLCVCVCLQVFCCFVSERAYVCYYRFCWPYTLSQSSLWKPDYTETSSSHADRKKKERKKTLAEKLCWTHQAVRFNQHSFGSKSTPSLMLLLLSLLFHFERKSMCAHHT